MAKQYPDEPPPRPIGHDNLKGILSRPILRFNLAAEIAHLHQQEAWSQGTGPSSTTLVKHPDLRVVLVALRKGETLAEHQTVARITVQVLTGALRLRLPGGIENLSAGQLLVLDRELTHNVEALADSAFLLTLAWPSEAPA